ncbi:MAG: DUF3078 domain-containing protein [Saprospiraceae bacterium]|jgi:hypothetical protein
MFRFIALFLGISSFFVCPVHTQPRGTAKQKKAPTDWQTGAGIGLDFSQLLQINPRQGAGQNRIGAGTALTVFAKRKKGRTALDNTASWQFGVQRLGSGPPANGGKLPFQKVIDEFRISSKTGYRASDTSSFFYAADFTCAARLRLRTAAQNSIREISCKFVEGKLRLVSQMILYSNYLRNPQNVDIDWTNELVYTVSKPLRLSLNMNVFYDDDVLVQITDFDAQGGVQGVGKRVSITQQFPMKYAINF